MWHKQRTVPFCLLLLAVTLALFWRVGSFDFIRFDDNDYVTRNRQVQAGLTWDGVVWAFQTTHASNWHPLTWLSHMLDCELYGLNAGSHHFTNLLFHTANALLLFLVLSRMSGAAWQSFFVAALFAWHPLHVESVAWVAERKDVLSTFFLLLTLGAYTRYVEQPKALWYGLTLLLFVLGLLAKPMLVTLPFVLLLLDFWPFGRTAVWGSAVKDGQPGTLAKVPSLPWTRLILEKLPFFAASLVSCGLTIWAQGKGGSIMSRELLPIKVRLGNAVVSYCEYLAKTVWPSRLAVFYPQQGGSPIWQVGLAFLLLAGITIMALRLARNHPYFLMGWLWFLGTLVPVIGIVQVGSQAMADRYSYVPIIGLFITVVWGGAEVWARWESARMALGLGIAAVLAGCVAVTNSQLPYWKDTMTLFEHTRDVTSRNYVAYTILGGELTEAGHPEEALPGLKLAVAYQPTYPTAHFCLGNAYYRLGQLDAAIASLSEAARLDPTMTEAFNEWGAALTQQRKFPQAEVAYRRALEIDPDYVAAKLNLGITLVKEEKPEAAIPLLNEVLAVNPNSVKAHLNLAKAWAGQGNYVTAIPHFLAALQLKPDDFEAERQLGTALHLQGQLDDALAYLQAAARLQPSDASCHYEMAVILNRQGKIGEAIQEYAAAVRLRPGYIEALNDLAWIRATNERAEFRNGLEAVQLAKQACELTKNEQPFLLGTLAAAYAETGQFPEAIATATKARDLAQARNQKETATKNQELLDLYLAGRPYHESAPKNAPDH